MLHVLRPFFPGRDWASPCWWEVVNESFFLLLFLLNLIHESFHLPLFLPTEWREQKAGWVFGCWLSSTHQKHQKTGTQLLLLINIAHLASLHEITLLLQDVPPLLHFHLLLHFPSHSISFQIISCGSNDIIPICSDCPHQNSWLFLQSWIGMAPFKTLNLTKLAFSFQRECLMKPNLLRCQTDTDFRP